MSTFSCLAVKCQVEFRSFNFQCISRERRICRKDGRPRILADGRGHVDSDPGPVHVHTFGRVFWDLSRVIHAIGFALVDQRTTMNVEWCTSLCVSAKICRDVSLGWT